MTVRERRPDAGGRGAEHPAVAGVAYTAAAPSQGGFDRPARALGGRRAGPRRGRPSLQLSARLGAAGTHEIAAQLAATSIPDRAGEDDRAAVAIAVPGGSAAAKALKALPRAPRREGGPVPAQRPGRRG